jgi:hypothetical protein
VSLKRDGCQEVYVYMYVCMSMSIGLEIVGCLNIEGGVGMKKWLAR